MSLLIEDFLQASVRMATPLAIAALGETVVQRAGMINLGLEGALIAGAFGALLGAGIGGVEGGFLLAAVAGIAVAAVFALFVVVLRADQIITGTAITLLAMGLTGTLYRIAFGEAGAALTIPTSLPLAVPVLSTIPIVGGPLFHQPPVTYAAYALLALIWYVLYRTHQGLALRAVGESPDAARSSGIEPSLVRALAVLVGGALGGVGGGALVLAQAGTFAEGMSAGRGFIAIAIVALGRWHPVGVALAALLFGAASAVQFFFQSLGWHLPYHFFLALPYVLTLLALAGLAGRAAPPAALGRTEARA